MQAEWIYDKLTITLGDRRKLQIIVTLRSSFINQFAFTWLYISDYASDHKLGMFVQELYTTG